MFLSKSEIIERKRNGELAITPILDAENQFEGAKVDLRLDNVFYRIRSEYEYVQDALKRGEERHEQITVPYSRSEEDRQFILHPGEFALGKTFEYVALPDDLVGILGGRSSIARQGIVIHATASIIDPGYTGMITLELSNFGNVPAKLNPRQRIATIMFAEVEETETYEGVLGQVGEAAPKYEDKDSDIADIRI